MTPIPIFGENYLEAICDIIGDTSSGLTGSEISTFLHKLEINDPSNNSNVLYSKRVRLFKALNAHQKRDACGNIVALFIQSAMDPVRYLGRTGLFNSQRERLNQALAFSGYSLGDDGKLRIVNPVQTLDEAEQRAGRLRTELLRRNAHPDVLRFCRSELLQENYFHAVFEATKSVAEKLRKKTGLVSDGSDLVDQALSLGKSGIPLLAFSSLQTETERSEQNGFANLIKGMFGCFRNVTAHAPKITWPIGEPDAIDLLSLASLLHRRLDSAVQTFSDGQNVSKSSQLN